METFSLLYIGMSEQAARNLMNRAPDSDREMLGSKWNGEGRSYINITFQDGYVFMITQEGLMEQSDDWLLEEVVINIQEGMSFEEVQDVIGGNPASITVSGTMEAITWRDHGLSSIRATFVDGELLDFMVVFVTQN